MKVTAPNFKAYDICGFVGKTIDEPVISAAAVFASPRSVTVEAR